MRLICDALECNALIASGLPDCRGGGGLDEITETQGTQDSDSWDRITGESPVALKVITDVKYDTSTHKITYRTRLLTFDRCGKLVSVGAESALVEVTEAVAHT